MQKLKSRNIISFGFKFCPLVKFVQKLNLNSHLLAHFNTRLLKFFRLIQPDRETLFQDLCREQVMMHVTPSEVKLQKKQRKVETEVVDLKSKLAAAQGAKSLVLSNREIRLLRLVAPKISLYSNKQMFLA
jgi:hypothetical protein